jgi:hypothetical protein
MRCFAARGGVYHHLGRVDLAAKPALRQSRVQRAGFRHPTRNHAELKSSFYTSVGEGEQLARAPSVRAAGRRAASEDRGHAAVAIANACASAGLLFEELSRGDSVLLGCFE